MSQLSQMRAMSAIKDFFSTVAKYFMRHLPLQNQMLKDLQILSLEKKTSDFVQAMKRMAIGLPQSISQSEMNYLLDDWKVYVLDDAQDDIQAHAGCIDEYWPRLLQAKLFLVIKSTVMPKVVKSALTLAHGNAAKNAKSQIRL